MTYNKPWRRSTLGIAVVVWGLCIADAQAVGVPVFSATELAQAVEQVRVLTEQLDQLRDQVATAKSQLTSLQQQAATMKGMYDDLSGISGHANMLPNVVTQWHSFLPPELQDVSSLLRGPVGNVAQTIRAAQQEFTAAALFPNAAVARQKAQYEKTGDYVFGYAAQAKTAFDGFAQRREPLEALSVAATTAATPKSTLDLIAKATAENALLLNDIALMLALDLKARMDGEILRYNQEALRAAPPSSTADVKY